MLQNHKKQRLSDEGSRIAEAVRQMRDGLLPNYAQKERKETTCPVKNIRRVFQIARASSCQDTVRKTIPLRYKDALFTKMMLRDAMYGQVQISALYGGRRFLK